MCLSVELKVFVCDVVSESNIVFTGEGHRSLSKQYTTENEAITTTEQQGEYRGSHNKERIIRHREEAFAYRQPPIQVTVWEQEITNMPAT